MEQFKILLIPFLANGKAIGPSWYTITGLCRKDGIEVGVK